MMRSPFKVPEGLSLSNLQTEVSGLLERLLNVGAGAISPGGLTFAPRIELREEADRFVVVADVPGIPAGAVDVSADPSSLTISGERPRPVQPSEEVCGDWPKVIGSELRYGRFARTIPLPTAIQVDAVSATARDGVLEIQLPKATVAKPVPVRVDVKPATQPMP